MAASGRDEVLREWERQAVLNDEHERRSFTGRRTYKAAWGGKTFQYAFGLAGAMERFSAGRAAHANELDYSLSFGWSWQEPQCRPCSRRHSTSPTFSKILAQRTTTPTSTKCSPSVHGPALIEVELKVSDAGVRSLLAAPDRAFEEARSRPWRRPCRESPPAQDVPHPCGRPRDIYGRAALCFQRESEAAAIAGRVDYNPGEDPASLNQLQKIDRGANPSGGLPDLSLAVLWTSSTSSTGPASPLPESQGRPGRPRRGHQPPAGAGSDRAHFRPDRVPDSPGPTNAACSAGWWPAWPSLPRSLKSLRVTPEDGVAILL